MGVVPYCKSYKQSRAVQECRAKSDGWGYGDVYEDGVTSERDGLCGDRWRGGPRG